MGWPGTFCLYPPQPPNLRAGTQKNEEKEKQVGGKKIPESL